MKLDDTTKEFFNYVELKMYAEAVAHAAENNLNSIIFDDGIDSVSYDNKNKDKFDERWNNLSTYERKYIKEYIRSSKLKSCDTIRIY